MTVPDELDASALAASLAVAWLTNPSTRASADDAASTLQALHAALLAMAYPAEPADGASAAAEHAPAVSIRKSLASREHIVSMIDGKPYRSLTRHLSSRGLTPDEYRERYGLRPDYPMVAPAFSEARSALSKTLGLGRKPRGAVSAAASAVEGPPAKPQRKKLGIAAAKAAAKEHLGG